MPTPLPTRLSILPAIPAFAPDGTPISRQFDDVYHSADGGPGQARHVFLAGNGLPRRWAGRERFVILENGFGTGLNFLATWEAWRNDPARPRRLHYLALEKHPFQQQDLARIHAHWPEFSHLASALRGDWPALTAGYHRIEFAAGRVVLTLMLGDAADCLEQLTARVDAFYLDGFDPKKNPEMWDAGLFRRMARRAAGDATLATWCVAGPVREALAQAGFATEKRVGFGRKREMLTGRLAAPHPDAPPPPEAPAAPVRHAVVLGAGLAGCALAERLAARDWRVEVVEAHAGPAREASGNRAGIVRPLLSRDDNLASRLSRACFLHTVRAWSNLDRTPWPVRRNFHGVLQIARDAEHEARQRELVAQGGYPENYLRFLERNAAGRLLGSPTRHGAWYFPRGGWANPPSVCASLLAARRDAVQLLAGRTAAQIVREGEEWRVLDADGQVLAAAPHLILASGAQAHLLEQAQVLPINRVRGQVSHLPAGSIPHLEHAVCCEGYLTPAVGGIHCLGASYAYDAGDELRLSEHADNLKRLARILPEAGAGLDPATLDGRVGFRAATPDRLPLVGALPDADVPLAQDARLGGLARQPGLHGLLGLGSRGLVWASLAAEALASQLDGDPLPLEADLLAALDPARFLLRQQRRGAGVR